MAKKNKNQFTCEWVTNNPQIRAYILIRYNGLLCGEIIPQRKIGTGSIWYMARLRFKTDNILGFEWVSLKAHSVDSLESGSKTQRFESPKEVLEYLNKEGEFNKDYFVNKIHIVSGL